MLNVIGIDLGLTNSRAATVFAGEPELIANSDGRRSTPSVVAVNPKAGERLIGEGALRQARLNPDNTIFEAKRIMGRRFDDAVVQELRYHLPFKIEPLPNGDAGIVLDGVVCAPAEISAMVLRQMKDDVEKWFGDVVRGAAIAVPPDFDAAQREYVRIAGMLAGFETIWIVDEPKAAVRASGLLRRSSTFAVYSLGAKSVEVTILQKTANDIVVLANHGDAHLGSDDFTRAIAEWMVELFSLQEMIDLKRSPDRSPLQRIREEAERVKIELSSQTESHINLPFLTADQLGPRHVSQTLTRALFERMVAELVERTIGPCDRALKDAGLTTSDIEEVLLVGAGTNMPLVRRRVAETFNQEPNILVSGEEAVAIGAAIEAAWLNGVVNRVVRATKSDPSTVREFSDMVASRGWSLQGDNRPHWTDSKLNAESERARRERREIEQARARAKSTITSTQTYLDDPHLPIDRQLRSDLASGIAAVRRLADAVVVDLSALEAEMNALKRERLRIGEQIYGRLRDAPNQDPS